MKAEGSTRRPVTSNGKSPPYSSMRTWAPDSSWTAFSVSTSVTTSRCPGSPTSIRGALAATVPSRSWVTFSTEVRYGQAQAKQKT